MVNDFARFNGLLTTLDELYESLYSAMRLAPTAYFANIDDVRPITGRRDFGSS